MAVDRYEFGGHIYKFVYEHNRLVRESCYASGLYSGQPRILTQIKDNKGCTLSELSERTGVGMPSLSVSVRNMKKSGLIEREDNRRRTRELYLTDEGLEKTQHFHEKVDALFAAIIDELGSERASQFAEDLERACVFMSKYTLE